MWKKLKGRPRHEQTYEQIRKLIMIIQPIKGPILKRLVKKIVVDTRVKQLKDNDLAYRSFRDLTPLEEENKTLKR